MDIIELLSGVEASRDYWSTFNLITAAPSALDGDSIIQKSTAFPNSSLGPLNEKLL